MTSKRKRQPAAAIRRANDPATSTAARLVLQHSPPVVASLMHVTQIINACLDHSHKWTLESASTASHVYLLDRLAAREWPEVTNVFREARFLYNIWAAARAGRVDVLSWWRTRYLPKGPDVAATIARIAAYNNHLSVIRWLFKADRHAASLRRMHRPLRVAEPEIMRWMQANEPSVTLEIDFHQVAARADMEFIEWCGTQFYACIVSERAVQAAAAGGSLQVLQYLIQLRPGVSVQRAFRTAGARGDLNMVQWLMGKYDDLASEDIIHGVIENGHFHLVKWFVDHGDWPDDRERDEWLVEAMHNAAIYGKMDMLQYLFSHLSVQDPNIHILDGGVSSDKIEIVKWLLDHDCVNDKNEDLVSLAAEGGNMEMLKWVHEHCAMYRTTTDAMDFAAERSLEMVKFLHDHRSEGCTSDAMDRAAAHGHLDIVQFLHENRSEGCTVHAMTRAAGNGCMDIVKFLRIHRTEGNTALAMNAAASRGQLDIVRWLFENGSVQREQVDEAYGAAITTGCFDLVTYMATHCRARCRQPKLEMILRCGHYQLLEWLMEHGSDPVLLNTKRDLPELHAMLSSDYCPVSNDLV